MNATEAPLDYQDESFTAIGFPMPGIEFYDCKFKTCNFSEQDLQGTKFFECTFENCNLANCNLTLTTFKDCNFHASKLMGVCFNPGNFAFFANFHDCDLRYVEFSALKIKNILIENCNCAGAKFMATDLKNAKLNNNDFTEVVFNECDLHNAQLLNAKNLVINPAANKIKNTKISLATAANIVGEFGFIVD